MKTHEFADLLLSMPDREFDISVDVPTNDVNAGERADHHIIKNGRNIGSERQKTCLVHNLCHDAQITSNYTEGD